MSGIGLEPALLPLRAGMAGKSEKPATQRPPKACFVSWVRIPCTPSNSADKRLFSDEKVFGPFRGIFRGIGKSGSIRTKANQPLIKLVRIPPALACSSERQSRYQLAADQDRETQVVELTGREHAARCTGWPETGVAAGCVIVCSTPSPIIQALRFPIPSAGSGNGRLKCEPSQRFCCGVTAKVAVVPFNHFGACVADLRHGQ